MYRRSRFNEELIQSPAVESPAVNAPSNMHVDMSPSPEALGKFLNYYNYSSHTYSSLPTDKAVRVVARGRSGMHNNFINFAL